MKPSVVVPVSVPHALRTALVGHLRASLAAAAASVAEARAADARDRRRLVALVPVGLYAALFGLAVVRPSPQSDVRNLADQLVCLAVDGADLRERVAVACPSLAVSVDEAQARALAGGPEALTLWAAMSPTEWMVIELAMRAADAAEQGAP